MAWGIKSRSGPGGLTPGGVHIDIRKDVYVDLGNNVRPGRPANSTKVPVPVPGTIPDPGVISDVLGQQYLTVYNVKQVDKEAALELWRQRKEMGKDWEWEPVDRDERCKRCGQCETYISFDMMSYRLTGGDFQIVGDSSAGTGKFIYATGGVTADTLFGKRYEMCCQPQIIEAWHVDRLTIVDGAVLDHDDPACWVVIDGESTYVCGCT